MAIRSDRGIIGRESLLLVRDVASGLGRGGASRLGRGITACIWALRRSSVYQQRFTDIIRTSRSQLGARHPIERTLRFPSEDPRAAAPAMLPDKSVAVLSTA
jgi:hypothetical protein